MSQTLGSLRFFLCVSCLLVCAATASAQFRAGVQGTVTDTSGAIVPGATVTLTSKETGKTQQIKASDEGFYRFDQLAPGTYGIRYAEWVEVPADCGGLCFPRSSLLRMGVYVPTAVWDAGYAGRGEGLLQVSNACGVRLQRGARIVQLVLFRLTTAASAGYTGAYQHENRR